MKVEIKYYIKLYSNFFKYSLSLFDQQRLNIAVLAAKLNAEILTNDEYFSAAGVSGSKHLSGLAGFVQYVV